MNQRPGKQAKAAPQPNPLAQEIRPGQSIELLKELHILTRDGKLNQDSRRKLKQVYHLFQFIEKLLLELPGQGASATLADHGAGKSYLGFIIYDLFFKALGGAMCMASKHGPNWWPHPRPWRHAWALNAWNS